jgi:hypothetical protein
MAAEIEHEYRSKMEKIAEVLDEVFNGTLKGHDRKVGFTLLIATFGDIKDGRVNYISNAERDDAISMMKELIARFEGRYSEDEGTV